MLHQGYLNMTASGIEDPEAVMKNIQWNVVSTYTGWTKKWEYVYV